MSEFEYQPGEELSSALRRAGAYLQSTGIDSGHVDAQLIAAHLFSREFGEDISRGRVQTLALTGAAVPVGFEELINERGARIPLQHLTGQAFFRHLTLKVGPGVFTPRPETELLVDHALDYLREQGLENPTIVDLCTGSGAIAAALATEAPGSRVFAVELSQDACAWSALNLNPVRVELVQGDATVELEHLVGTVDVVATNPPYIPNGAVPKDPEVRDHDPHMALFGGSEDGMKIPTAIAARAFELLKPGGFVIMEHAETQGELAATLFENLGFTDVQSIVDLAGKPRHTAGRKPSA